jgi:hypothetical protein
VLGTAVLLSFPVVILSFVFVVVRRRVISGAGAVVTWARGVHSNTSHLYTSTSPVLVTTIHCNHPSRPTKRG